jgi:3-oxoacyl-[acyl-carrier protein] reductase
VTGASRGVGRATALELARRGLELGLVGRPSAELSESLALARAAGAPRALPFHADMSVAEQVEGAARGFLAAFGAPDAVIQNAGVALRTSVEDTTLAAWEAELSANLTGPFVLTRALLPALRASGRGRIVFVGSISSTLGTANLSGYCASKWGIVGFMKSLAEELSGSGLMTCAVLPGSIATRMLADSGYTPRMTAEDVAKTLVHYALDAPLAHNGASIEMFGS